MVRVSGLQGADQNLKFRKLAQTLQTGILQKEWPTREPSADAALQPLESSLTPPEQPKNTGNLIVSVVRVSKRLWDRASLGHAFERGSLLPGECAINALQTDDHRFFGKNPDSFVQ